MHRRRGGGRLNRKNIVVSRPENPLNKGKSPNLDTAINSAQNTSLIRKFYGGVNSFEIKNCSKINNKNLLVTCSGKINFYKKDCSNNTAKNNLSNSKKPNFSNLKSACSQNTNSFINISLFGEKNKDKNQYELNQNIIEPTKTKTHHKTRLLALIFSLFFIFSTLLTSGVFLIVNYVSKSNATTTGTSTLANIYNTDGTVNGKATYEVLKAIGYYDHENDTGTYTAHNIAGRTSNGSGSTVIFPMGYYVSKSGTMDTTKPIYWQAVYLSNGYLTIWMNNNYTYDYYNNGTNTSSGWGNGKSYDTYSNSNYSKSTLRDITNNIYTALSGKLTNFSTFVKSPSEAGATWQQTEKEDVYTVSSSYYDHHNNLYYSSTSNYGGSYTDWSHSKWNSTNQPYSDKFWIPSSAEVLNNVAGSGNKSQEKGLWGLNADDRGFKSINNDTNTIEGSSATIYCWLRSGYSGNIGGALRVHSSGSADGSNVVNSRGVRPACHISLNKLAKYATSTVTLDQQGGSGGTASVTVISDSAMPSITIPTRAGYIFGGYYTGTNGSGTQYYTESGTSVRNWDISGDTTLYAKWTAITYILLLNVNNSNFGTILNSGGSLMEGTTYTTYAIAKNNCAFLYWIDSTNPTVPIYDNPLTITVTADKTYTAYFTDSLTKGIMVTSTIGGSVELLGDDYANLADTDTVTLVARIKITGYQFDGWFIQGETTAFATDFSVRVAYGNIKDKIIVARFSKISNNINIDTDNTKDFY